MARRRQSGYDQGYEDEGAPARARRRRRSGPNGVLIALACAGAVGIVMLFVISSGASGEQEVADARAVMRELFDTFVKNDVERGKTMVDPRQILADTQRLEMKAWNEMSEEKQKEKQVEAWRFLKSAAEAETDIEGLGIHSMADADALLNTMTFDWNPAQNEVVVKWDMVGRPWRARLLKNDLGTFTVFDFRIWRR